MPSREARDRRTMLDSELAEFTVFELEKRISIRERQIRRLQKELKPLKRVLENKTVKKEAQEIYAAGAALAKRTGLDDGPPLPRRAQLYVR